MARMGRMKRHEPGEEGFEVGFEVRAHGSALDWEAFRALPRLPAHLVLDRLRSAWNVGAVFRLADAARAAEVVTCGYTAHPPHEKLAKTALGAERCVPTRHFATTADAVKALQSEGTPVYALELAPRGETLWNVAFPRPVALVLGNEAEGVSQDVLSLCDRVVEIPMYGYKNCINVAAACAVALFEIARQWTALGEAGSPPC